MNAMSLFTEKNFERGKLGRLLLSLIQIGLTDYAFPSYKLLSKVL